MNCAWREVGGARCSDPATYWAVTVCKCRDEVPGRGAVCIKHAAIARAGTSVCTSGAAVVAVEIRTLDVERVA